MSPHGIVLVLALGCALGGCGTARAPAAFDLRRPEPDAAELALLANLVQAPAPRVDGRALILAVGAEGLSLHDAADGRLKWRIEADPDSQPLLLSGLVVFTQGGRLRAHRLDDGRLRFELALREEALLGAALDSERLIVTTVARGPGAGALGARIIALDPGNGGVRWSHQVPGRLGAPALRGEHVFVPWNYQHLCVLDARSGRERLRLTTRDGVVRWVSSEAAGVVFGDRQLRLLATGSAPLDGPPLALDPQPLPGKPPIRPSGYEPLPPPGTAEGQVSLEFALAESSEPKLRDDGSYLVFFRHVLGFEPSGELRFARTLPADVVRAATADRGLYVVTRDGGLWMLDSRDGRTRHRAQLGFEPQAAALTTEGLDGREPSEPSSSLRAMLSALALDADSRLLPTRAFAVRALAALPEPDVTRDLLDIYRQSSTPVGLARVIAEQLKRRTSGAEHLLAALAERPDFLEQTRPAPLEAVVPALEQMGEHRAVAPLVARMLDHETPLEQLPMVVRAIGALGGPSALPPLRRFLQLYRADSSFAEHPQALIAAAEAVARIGGAAEHGWLEALAHRSSTHAALSEAIERRLSPEPEPTPQDVAQAVSEPPAPIRRLSQHALQAAFAEHAAELRQCVLEELGRNPRLSWLRIAFVAQPDGTPRAISLSPNGAALSGCLLPRLEALRFAPFDGERHLVDFVIAVRAFAHERPPPHEPPDGPWWAPSLARGSAEPARGQPWWRDKNTLQALLEPAAPPEAAPSVPPSLDIGPRAAPKADTKGPPEKPQAAQDAWWEPAR